VWLVQSDEATLQAPGVAARTSPSLRVEKTTLTGLQPNTRYEYDVSGQDAGKGSFKTPVSGVGVYTFAVYGDTRTRHDVHRKVINALVEHVNPDFVVHTGDLVADGSDSSLWPVFFDIEKELLRHTVFFPSLGNHERNSRDYYDFFQVTTPYYSFDWGNGHFIVLNSDIGNAASSEAAKETFWMEQTRWLEEDLRSHQDAAYRFVFAHHPPFTAVARRQGDNPHMTALTPMFERYRVTAGFFGHDHNYQRYLKNGIHYVITGGGGAPLYDVDKPADGITQKVVSAEHFVTVTVDGDTARIEAIAADGRKLDEIELHAAGKPGLQ
jgi:3',5'-cyclic AMP phosphodiesterase CpdA